MFKIQFSGKNGQNNSFAHLPSSPVWEILDPPLQTTDYASKRIHRFNTYSLTMLDQDGDFVWVMTLNCLDHNLRTNLLFNVYLQLNVNLQQDCIPVGCVQSAAVAVGRGGRVSARRGIRGVCLPMGVSAHGGCLPMGGVCPWGVSAQGKGCLPGGCLSRGLFAQGVSPWGCLPGGCLTGGV